MFSPEPVIKPSDFFFMVGINIYFCFFHLLHLSVTLGRVAYEVRIDGYLITDTFNDPISNRQNSLTSFAKSKSNEKPKDKQNPAPTKGHLEGKSKSNNGQTAEPPGEYPGDDSTKAPDGYDWRGKPGSQPGSKAGSYYNPDTGEVLRPDLDHPEGIDPHWDYKDPSGNWWRWFPGD